MPIAALNITDKDVLDRFSNAISFIGGNTYGPYKRKVVHHKDMYRWQVSGFEKVQALVAIFWPWLGERRREIVEGVLKTFIMGRDSAEQRLICTESDCELPHLAKGLCSKHYQRWRYENRRRV